jgi:TIR domain
VARGDRLRRSSRAGAVLRERAARGPAPDPRPAYLAAGLDRRNLAEEAPEPGVDRAKAYDVFISHAGEDKDAVVRPLAGELVDRGVSVWFDEFELRIGDSLRRKIDHGIARSRFGIVVVSRSFFAKSWPQYELDGLVTRERSGKQVILPVWHEITKDEIEDESPSLADKVALATDKHSIGAIADEVAAVILGDDVADAA